MFGSSMLEFGLSRLMTCTANIIELPSESGRLTVSVQVNLLFSGKERTSNLLVAS